MESVASQGRVNASRSFRNDGIRWPAGRRTLSSGERAATRPAGSGRRVIMAQLTACGSLMAAALIGAVTSLAADSGEAPFLAENRAAMNRMMTAMSIEPSGDVDADFVAMMVPHHQGAIEMAQAELRYGH